MENDGPSQGSSDCALKVVKMPRFVRRSTFNKIPPTSRCRQISPTVGVGEEGHEGADGPGDADVHRRV